MNIVVEMFEGIGVDDDVSLDLPEMGRQMIADDESRPRSRLRREEDVKHAHGFGCRCFIRVVLHLRSGNDREVLLTLTWFLLICYDLRVMF